jgi:hypothetical protein
MAAPVAGRHVHPILALQRAIGNHAVQGLLQRACACGGKSPEGECDECKLSRKASGESATGAPVPGVVGEVLRSAGRPLDAATQTLMDTRFHSDFSRVRIHDDARAAESASAVSALAYTVGHHVVFGQGHYSPTTAAGRRLLAHELTHVVQQSASGSASAQAFSIGPANSPAEREAEAMADAVTAGAPLPLISESSAAPLNRARLDGTGEKEAMLNLGSAKSLACCDTNACVDDTGGFDCDGFDCPTETGDKSAKNNLINRPKHKFSPHLKCDSKCDKDFKATYSGKEMVVAMPSGRRRKSKNQCGQTLGLCAKGKSLEVTVREFSNHDVWEASPGVWDAFGVNPDSKDKPDLFVSIYEQGNDPEMKDDPKCTPPAKPSPKKPKDKP